MSPNRRIPNARHNHAPLPRGSYLPNSTRTARLVFALWHAPPVDSRHQPNNATGFRSATSRLALFAPFDERSTMRSLLLTALGALALMVGWHGAFPPVAAQIPGGGGGGPGPHPLGMEPPRFPDFNTVMRGAKELDGFFKLHQKDDHVY